MGVECDCGSSSFLVCFSDMYFDNSFCAVVHLLFVVYRCVNGCYVSSLQTAVCSSDTVFPVILTFSVRDDVVFVQFDLYACI